MSIQVTSALSEDRPTDSLAVKISGNHVVEVDAHGVDTLAYIRPTSDGYIKIDQGQRDARQVLTSGSKGNALCWPRRETSDTFDTFMTKCAKYIAKERGLKFSK